MIPQSAAACPSRMPVCAASSVPITTRARSLLMRRRSARFGHAAHIRPVHRPGRQLQLVLDTQQHDAAVLEVVAVLKCSRRVQQLRRSGLERRGQPFNGNRIACRKQHSLQSGLERRHAAVILCCHLSASAPSPRRPLPNGCGGSWIIPALPER